MVLNYHISQQTYQPYESVQSVDHRIGRRNPDNLLLKNNGFKKHPCFQLQTALFKELTSPERYSFFFYLKISDKRKNSEFI